jgi:tRNA nucleotidyltransferase/poly(A) polymerase
MKRMDNKSAAVEIIKRLRDQGHEAYLVGGCVRDMLLGRKNPKEEHDVTTSARTEEVVKLFHKTLLVGAQFGVVLVGVGGHWIEVASFRSDESYSDGRHPDHVRIGTMQEDAERRDFTMNSLFFDPIENKIIDLVGGRADIEKRVIRAIGSPDLRFQEDHLRMLRAVRFAGQLENFYLDPATADAIRRLAGRIVDISTERVLEEMKKLLPAPGRVTGLKLADDLGLLQQILPEVSALHQVPGAFEQTLAVLARLPEACPFEIAMAALLHLTGEGSGVRSPIVNKVRPRLSPHTFNPAAKLADAIARRLTCSNQERIDIVWMIQYLPFFARAADLTLADLKRLMLYGRYEGLLCLYRARVNVGLEPAENLKIIESLAERVTPESLQYPPLITGRDLTEELHLNPSPDYQKILDEVYDAQLNEEIHTRQEAITLARKIIST